MDTWQVINCSYLAVPCVAVLALPLRCLCVALRCLAAAVVADSQPVAAANALRCAVLRCAVRAAARLQTAAAADERTYSATPRRTTQCSAARR